MIANETAELPAAQKKSRFIPICNTIQLTLGQLHSQDLKIDYEEDWQTVPQRSYDRVRYTIRLPSASGFNAERLACKILSTDKAFVTCIIASDPAVVVAKMLSYMAGFRLQRKTLPKLTVAQWLKLTEAMTKLQSTNLLMACDHGWRLEDFDEALTELTNAQGKQMRAAIIETTTFSNNALLIVAKRH